MFFIFKLFFSITGFLLLGNTIIAVPPFWRICFPSLNSKLIVVSLIPLFCAHVLTGLSFISDIYLLIPLALTGTLCVWLSIHMIFRRINGLSLEQITFKNIILIAFLSSILNSIGNFVTKMALIDDYGTLFNQELFLYILGDFLGTILLFLLYVKWLKKYLVKFFSEKR